ncbi:hypothetical protein KAJ27_21975 [bacterium]|nr:hypothetical protein [bacterium]
MIFNILIFIIVVITLFILTILFVPYRIKTDVAFEKESIIKSFFTFSWFWGGIKFNISLVNKEFIYWNILLMNFQLYKYHVDDSISHQEDDFESETGFKTKSIAGRLKKIILSKREFFKKIRKKIYEFKQKILKYKFLLSRIPFFISRTFGHFYRSFNLNGLKIEIHDKEMSLYLAGMVSGLFAFLTGIFKKNLDLNLIRCYSKDDSLILSGNIDISIKLYMLVYMMCWLIIRKETFKTGLLIYKERK